MSKTSPATNSYNEKKKLWSKKYYVENKELITKKRKAREKTLNFQEERKKYNQTRKEKTKAYNKEYSKNNSEKIKKQRKEYRKENNEIIRERKRLYAVKKRKTDNLFKLKENIRTLIRNSFQYKNHKKSTKTANILCISFNEFKKYLESKFESWMTWDNYGKYNGTSNYGWDIDHIIPLSKSTSEQEIIELNHYTNLQPLCSYKNRDIKKNKF